MSVKTRRHRIPFGPLQALLLVVAVWAVIHYLILMLAAMATMPSIP